MIAWFVTVVLAGLLGVAVWYLVRFVRIILSIEDALGEAIEIHERSIATFDQLLGMQLFFDSPEVKHVLTQALADVKVCKMATNKVVARFTAMSKQRYYTVVADTKDDE